ncbi:GspE/PulE family protein [Algisphaera agarilytica]|uniref:Type IV pilus assembly protein PilB n=1 Tax=Algisphaera agarilytica TaxID=1385975 RepID=A0A7X0LKL5_9BACT|nr:GspE/PulE family protein [Algisphaera agarilytica]MBB6430037.1 type IV pilus assembly protein PilB [Algisphaera agarilytica]
MTALNSNQSSPQTNAAPAPRVGDLLLEKGLITDEQIEQALAFQKSRGHKKLLGEVLVEMEFVTTHQVMEALADAYGVPFARLTSKMADPKVVGLLEREFLESQTLLPLFLVQGKLTLAMAEPTNVFVVDEVERMTGHTVQVVATTPQDIEETLKSVLPDGNVFVIDDMMDVSDSDLSVVEKQITDLSDLENSASESPVIKLVNYIVYAAVKDGASDIHIEPDDGNLRVRYRVDGRLFEKLSPPHQMLAAVVSRIKIMAGLDISERRVPQDGGITIVIDKRQIDLRVSTCPGKFGEKVVIRIIDTRNAMTSLDKLGFGYEMLESFRSTIHEPNGVFLVTGPTGSGKSTSLYAALNEINNEAINISTVEDPVEYNLSGVNQFQVNEKAGFTFSGALRSLLRQDPDVIMLGEIRDQETAKIATQAALTGHMVLSTLHTNDAPSAITRLYNIGVEPYLVAASIRGVLAQRLVRKICKHCKEQVEMTHTLERTIERLVPAGEAPLETVYHGTGCPKCRETGYAGRLGIYELMIPDDECLDLISRGAGLQELRRHVEAGNGYTTLRQDGLEKVRAGLTTLEELFKATAG